MAYQVLNFLHINTQINGTSREFVVAVIVGAVQSTASRTTKDYWRRRLASTCRSLDNCCDRLSDWSRRTVRVWLWQHTTSESTTLGALAYSSPYSIL